MYGYVINHFGDNIKYLEYEIYFLINLRKLTKHDIIYLYSIYDTPKDFIDIIKKIKLNITFVKYNDDNFTINLTSKFKSHYEHFNTLRTCNFTFAYLLTKYEKLCILESDMYILNSIDDIFDLQTPSVYYKLNKGNIKDDTVYKLTVDPKKVLDGCTKGTSINGGVLLIKPSKKMFSIYVKKINNIIKNNCIFPNETLFLACEKNINNLPIRYNYSHYHFDKFNKFKDIRLIHYHSTLYKPIDIIKDNYIHKLKCKNSKKIIKMYNDTIYIPHMTKVNKLLLMNKKN